MSLHNRTHGTPSVRPVPFGAFKFVRLTVPKACTPFPSDPHHTRTGISFLRSKYPVLPKPSTTNAPLHVQQAKTRCYGTTALIRPIVLADTSHVGYIMYPAGCVTSLAAIYVDLCILSVPRKAGTSEERRRWPLPCSPLTALHRTSPWR